jgi:hypothetical protein
MFFSFAKIIITYPLYKLFYFFGKEFDEDFKAFSGKLHIFATQKKEKYY